MRRPVRTRGRRRTDFGMRFVYEKLAADPGVLALWHGAECLVAIIEGDASKAATHRFLAHAFARTARATQRFA